MVLSNFLNIPLRILWEWQKKIGVSSYIHQSVYNFRGRNPANFTQESLRDYGPYIWNPRAHTYIIAFNLGVLHFDNHHEDLILFSRNLYKLPVKRQQSPARDSGSFVLGMNSVEQPAKCAEWGVLVTPLTWKATMEVPFLWSGWPWGQ